MEAPLQLLALQQLPVLHYCLLLHLVAVYVAAAAQAGALNHTGSQQRWHASFPGCAAPTAEIPPQTLHLRIVGASEPSCGFVPVPTCTEYSQEVELLLLKNAANCC